jgi:valyl-tRNA synthetase
MIAEYPTADEPRSDAQAEEEIGLVMQAIRAVRNTRAQLRIPGGQRLEAQFEVNGMHGPIEEEAEVIRVLSRVDPLHIVADSSSGNDLLKGVTLVVNPLIIHLPLEGVVDLSAEAERLRTELDECVQNMNRVENLVSNPNFLQKAKPEVVETEQARLQDLKERQQHLNEILEQLAG